MTVTVQQMTLDALLGKLDELSIADADVAGTKVACALLVPGLGTADDTLYLVGMSRPGATAALMATAVQLSARPAPTRDTTPDDVPPS